jgi:predicted Zn-dependent protease with MMP-like domain
MLTIDEAQEILEEVAEGLPPEFFDDLNGGIILLPEVRKSQESWGENLYTLGEYFSSSSMGRYIAIYYGSFEHVFNANDSNEEIANELKNTLLHEFTHHMECISGVDNLEKEDERRLNDYKFNAVFRKTNKKLTPKK